MEPGSKMIFIAPGKDLEKLARQVALELNVELRTFDQAMEEALETARHYLDEGVECIISRGPTGVYLKNHLSIPIIQVQVTAFDILQALNKAYRYGDCTAYIDHVHRMNAYDFEAMQELIGIPDLKLYFYCNMEMLQEQLNFARQDKVATVVAPDDTVLRQAERRGIRGIEVCSSHEAVADAVSRAKEIIKLLHKDRESSLFMQTIINHTENALISLDDQYRIIYLNRPAEKLLGVNRTAVSLLEEISRELIRLVQDNARLVNKVILINNHKVVVNCMSLFHNGGLAGKVITLHQASKIQQMEANIREELYAKGLIARYNFEDIIGNSTQLKSVLKAAKKYALSDSMVLITGESGTGKELFAHSIHQDSYREKGPFVTVNCAAIPESLLESELFGYSEGAFTGAIKGGKPGLFEIAHGGTIFLDEVSEMPLPLQARLLRVLQEKAVRRVGGDRLNFIDTRIIAATNQNLPDLVARGKFRQDLYFRLNLLNLTVPPLRERVEDIMPLVQFFTEKHLGKGKELPGLPGWAARRLKEYSWPGNIRELESFVERLITLAADGSPQEYLSTLKILLTELTGMQYGAILSSPSSPEEHLLIKIDTLGEMEKQILSKLKKINNHNNEQLARKLGISRTTLWKKLKEGDRLSGDPV
ncbi:MAG: sigma 54-interacting transcriptional regulator [Bacillota bacterium]